MVDLRIDIRTREMLNILPCYGVVLMLCACWDLCILHPTSQHFFCDLFSCTRKKGFHVQEKKGFHVQEKKGFYVQVTKKGISCTRKKGFYVQERRGVHVQEKTGLLST